jgi:outer membrane protein insertion porin family
VAGNTKTRDEVVRREMRQLEGAYYDSSKIQLSRRRIDRTQYFKEVNVETAPIEGSPDQVDVNYTVEEKPTGALLVGAGFSSVDRLILSASITQSNAFGNGKFLSLEINSGTVNRTYSLSYMDPYYTVDGVSRGFDMYRRDVDASSLSIGAYATKAIGGGVKFGYPLSERDSLSFGMSAEQVRLETFSSSPFAYRDFVASFGNAYTYGALQGGWARDSRDSLIMTTQGSVMRATTEFAGGDLQYYRLGYNQQYYHPLSRKLTLFLSGDLGVAGGLGGKPLPFFKNFYAGGPGSVRGYRPYSLGPQDPQGNALGGNRRLVASAEILFPVPGADQDKSLRMAAFIDGGQVYGRDEKVSLSELRFSAGIALSWASPFGPLRISLGNPLNEKKGIDRAQRLQLTIGTGI